jgi:CheY-like chemotaxis protein
MSSQGKSAKLLLRSYSLNGRVVMEVSDNGPGIPPNILPRIFDPFFSTKKQGRGTGLGLSVSYGIVREHGGELRVESREGEGTKFSTLLPIHVAPRDLPAGGKPAVASAMGGKRILVVDDEEIIVELYLQLLQALGHQADTAATGVEALKKIESRDYDLIITDIKMPRMTGIQLYEKVVAVKPSMQRRFIFITGDMNSLTSQQISTVTDNPCLLKPVNIEKIESTIRQVLSGQPPLEPFPAVSR